MSADYDVVILGQGLAGTALAWWFRWTGKRVIVIDRDAPVTSSKIAAGLITPITGQKLVPAWNLARLWPVAVEFYRHVEHQTGTSFFRQLPMVRFFQSIEERSLFIRRRDAGEYQDFVRAIGNDVDCELLVDEFGGFEMFPCGQLHTARYLQASRQLFQNDGGMVTEDLDVSRDIRLDGDQVRIDRLGILARQIAFCQGAEVNSNPWFRDIDLRPAKGEILTVRVPGLSEARVVHRGIWIAPLGDALFKVGSTYDWHELDLTPTSRGRDQILSQLDRILKYPVEVIDHQAAVRPIHRNQFPVIGVHPRFSQLAIFNGLGSKGSLQSPYYARQLVELLAHGSPVDADVDLHRKTARRTLTERTSPDCPVDANSSFHVKRQPYRPLTERAQEAVRQSLRPGEIAVDATAGNGHDTHFLAGLVGSTGSVFAFDIQPEAIERTSTRLRDHQIQNVVLLNCDHAVLTTAIPIQHHGRVGAIMFNLGYLPGGDKQIITSAESTRTAINAATEMLRLGGTMTIVCYTGHDGGAAEAEVVQSELSRLSRPDFDIEVIESQAGRRAGPRLFVVKRGSTPPSQRAGGDNEFTSSVSQSD